MKPKEKESTMRAFKRGEIQALVATTVVEVGVDVPNATVMMVENAENVLCTTEYGENFASGVVKDNICAVQFHPEKSGKWGLQMLKNFVEM